MENAGQSEFSSSLGAKTRRILKNVKWSLGSLAAFAAGAYLVLGASLYLSQDQILLPATPVLPDLREQQSGSDTIAIFYAQNQFAGYVVSPANVNGLRGTVIIYHGNQEAAESKLPLALQFERLGYRVVIVEYPGIGRRPGSRTMVTTLAAARAAFLATLGQWKAPVYVVGESLGAGIAAQVVPTNERDIAGVLLITPWDSLASVAQEKYPLFPTAFMLHNRFDSVSAVSHYEGPLLLIGAQEDTLIPVAHAYHFANTAHHASLLLLPHSGHDDWYEHMRSDDWQRVISYLHLA